VVFCFGEDCSAFVAAPAASRSVTAQNTVHLIFTALSSAYFFCRGIL